MARPSRPPLRQHTPDEVRSGFPFLIAMAAIVLVASVAAVAKFCPQDLELRHARARTVSAAATPPPPAPPAPAADVPPPVITPMTVTTIDAPPAAASASSPTPVAAPPAKKVAAKGRLPSSRLPTKPAASAPAAPAASASADPVPDNPYEQASPPGTYGF